MKNKNIFKRINLVEFLFALVILVAVSFKIVVPIVMAGNFSRATLRFDRMRTSYPSSMLVTFVPAGAGTVAAVKLVFGTGITVAAAPTVNTTGLPAGITALPGTFTVAGSGSSITVSGVTALTVGTTYGFNIATGVSTPSTAGQLINTLRTLASGTSATIDETDVASYFVADDQIVITAQVPPIFTFVLSGNTDTFTTDLSSASVVSTNGQTVTVTTNAAKGWTGWLRSANQALSSVTTGQTIPTTASVGSTTTLVAGTDGYVLFSTVTTTGTGTGTLTRDAAYDGGTASGGRADTNFQVFGSRTGTTGGDVITLRARAAIVATKAAAGDYTDTLTVVGAGNF